MLSGNLVLQNRKRKLKGFLFFNYIDCKHEQSTVEDNKTAAIDTTVKAQNYNSNDLNRNDNLELFIKPIDNKGTSSKVKSKVLGHFLLKQFRFDFMCLFLYSSIN